MAETGSKSPLDAEIAAARAAGTAQNLLSSGGIGLSPGALTYRFEVSTTHPLVTLVSMLAPSPDWFVGVSGLSLMQAGDWVDGISVDLFAYDAGTDSGASFSSPDADTDPAEPVSRIVGAPFVVQGSVPRVGVFTFRRQQ